jgi:hypothetical protein
VLPAPCSLLHLYGSSRSDRFQDDWIGNGRDCGLCLLPLFTAPLLFVQIRIPKSEILQAPALQMTIALRREAPC